MRETCIMDDPEIQRLTVRLYREGRSIDYIASQTLVSYGTIQRFLKARSMSREKGFRRFTCKDCSKFITAGLRCDLHVRLEASRFQKARRDKAKAVKLQEVMP